MGPAEDSVFFFNLASSVITNFLFCLKIYDRKQRDSCPNPCPQLHIRRRKGNSKNRGPIAKTQEKHYKILQRKRNAFGMKMKLKNQKTKTKQTIKQTERKKKKEIHMRSEIQSGITTSDVAEGQNATVFSTVTR